MVVFNSAAVLILSVSVLGETALVISLLISIPWSGVDSVLAVWPHRYISVEHLIALLRSRSNPFMGIHIGVFNSKKVFGVFFWDASY